MKNKHGPLKLKTVYYYRRCCHHPASPGHYSQIRPPMSRGEAYKAGNSEHPSQSRPAGNPSPRLPRPAKTLTLDPRPGGRPGGWSLAWREIQELRPSHQGLSRGPSGYLGKSGPLGEWALPGAAPSSPPLLSGSGLPAPTPSPAPVAPAPGLRPGSHRLIRLHADLEGLLLQRFERDRDGHGGARATRRPRDPHTTCNSRRRHLSAQPRRKPTASGAGGARADHRSTCPERAPFAFMSMHQRAASSQACAD